MQLSLRRLSVANAALFCLLAGLAVRSFAQNRSMLPRMGTPVFQHLTRNAGYIFSGTVTAVSMIEPGSRNSLGATQITFHVENAFRGVRKGQTLVIREWAGLWQAGEHYRVGERVTLFLFAPGKLGLTSPVGRQLGRFQLDPYGRVLLNREHISAISTDPALASRWQGKNQITWKEFSRAIQHEIQEY
ncbi:MAG: hypothetical protein ACRD2U_16465 [Terriglobales bacterium]